jgi:hypothetical protein
MKKYSNLMVLFLVGCLISLSSCFGPSEAEKQLVPVMHDLVIMNAPTNRTVAALNKMTDAQLKSWNECQAKVAAKICGNSCNTADGAATFALVIPPSTSAAIEKDCPQSKFQ